MLLRFPTALSSLCVPDIEEGKGPYLHALCVEKGEGVTLSTVHRGGRGSDTAYCREGLTLPTTHRGSGDYDLILMEFECYLGGRGHSSIPFHYSIPLILDSLLSLSPCSAILSVWLHHLAMLLSAWVCVCVWVCGGRGVFVFLCVYLCVFVCVCVCQLF